MSVPTEPPLSRREREIMDIVYARGRATVTEVLQDMVAPPGRTAVRTLMRILEEKGHLKHKQKGREFVYQPVRTRISVGRSALRRVLRTFFDGSLERAVSVHLSDPGVELTPDELDRLARLVNDLKDRED